MTPERPEPRLDECMRDGCSLAIRAPDTILCQGHYADQVDRLAAAAIPEPEEVHGYRRARGVSPMQPGDPLPEEAIRRIRDAAPQPEEAVPGVAEALQRAFDELSAGRSVLAKREGLGRADSEMWNVLMQARLAVAVAQEALAAVRAEPPREGGSETIEKVMLGLRSAPREAGGRCTTMDGHHFYRCDICEAVMDTPLSGLLEVGPREEGGGALEELTETIRLVLRRGMYQMPGDKLPYQAVARAVARAVAAARAPGPAEPGGD